jgi:hypothetical protein
MKVIGGSLAIVFLLTGAQGSAQMAATPHRGMAPVERYLMPRDVEISLARSAAPRAVSADAEILILTRSGYQPVVRGTNGFVCMVARSWSAPYDDPDFWSPRLRAPICYNASAALSQVPATLKRTQVALAGGSKAQILGTLKAAIADGELPVAKAGSMAYMMSRQTYLNRRSGHWLPHLMFFAPQTDPRVWGAGLPDSPILGINSPEEHLTVFLIPLGRWSDGTKAPAH